MVKNVKKKAFWIIFWIMTLIGLMAGAGIYYLGEQVLSLGAESQGEQLLDKATLWLTILGGDNFYYWAIPGVIAFFVLIGILIWAAVTSSMETPVSKSESTGTRTTPPAKKDFLDHKIEQERKQRLFLHSLSILQREGRLLDFFDEDLSRYEDGQIGAAVRSIQEDCKKAVKKYIDLRPVLQGNEGEAITIEEGFDIDAINLVGNVAGQPPFSGIIRHPGWKAGKKEVPKLSDVQDSAIMTPAEVEIQ